MGIVPTYTLILLVLTAIAGYRSADAYVTVRAYLGQRPSTYTYDHLNQLAQQALAEAHGDRKAASRALHRKVQLPKRSIDTLISLQG